MNDITKYKRNLRRKYGLDLIITEDHLNSLNHEEEKSRKKIADIDIKLDEENDSEKKLKLEMERLSASIENEIINSKMKIIRTLLNYKESGSKLDLILSGINKNAKSIQALNNVNHNLSYIRFSNYIDNPFSKEYILTSDIVYNISLLNIPGNNPFENKNLNTLFSELSKEYKRILDEIKEGSVDSCKKSLNEIKTAKQDIKVNGLSDLSKEIEDLCNNIKQELKVKPLMSNFGIEPVNYFHSKIINTKFDSGDIRTKKLIADCNSIGISVFRNLNIYDIAEKINQIQYYEELKYTLLEYKDALPESYRYGNKSYSNNTIKICIDNIVDYIQNKLTELKSEVEKSNFDEYEQLIKSIYELDNAEKDAEKAEVEYHNANYKEERNAAHKKEMADKKVVEKYKIFSQLAQNLNVFEDIQNERENKKTNENIIDEIEVNNQNRELYQMKAEERIIAKNEYFKSGSFLKITFADYLRRKGQNELAHLEEYIINLLESIYAKYESTDKSITFKQFINYNENLKSMLKDFVSPHDLDDFISHKENENKRKEI